MKKLSTGLKLFILFAVIFNIKIALSFLMSGTFMYSDESCVVHKAIFFIEHFRIASCQSIIGAPAGDPMPLYSIIISPIFLFFRGINAYYAVLILNSFLVSSLTFPLFKIYKHFIKRETIIFAYISLTLFLPHVLLFEKMLQTESIFFVNLIWFLYFYIESFYQNHTRNKIIAVILATFASLTRPFGFIMLLSMIFNELVQKKRKKTLLIALIILSIISIAFVLSFMPGIIGMLYDKVTSLNQWNNILAGFIAIKNQINSYLIGTFVVPVIIFFTYIDKKDFKTLQKIRYFLLSFIFLNFIISANHIWGYLMKSENLDLLTRYINSSSILIIIFSLIFIEKYDKFKLNFKNTIVLGITFVCLIFLTYADTKHSLNLLISNYYDINAPREFNRLTSTDFLVNFFMPTAFMLFAMFIFNKKRLLHLTLTGVLLVHSTFLFAWFVQFSSMQQNNPIFKFFKPQESHILYLQSYKDKSPTYEFWRLVTLTNNKVTSAYVNDFLPRFKIPNFNSDEGKAYLEENEIDYIITRFELGLTKLPMSNRFENVYPIIHDET